jgi:hypothetical protein
MKIYKLNVSQICSVRSYIKLECNNYEYLKERKLFCWVTRKEGFYYRWSFRGDKSYVTVDEINANGKLLCDGETVYYKPHIEIRMSNQTVHDKYFETEKELNDFMESEQMKSVTWINKDK